MKIKIKTILWTYKELSNGEYEIRLRLTLYKQVSYISTGYSSTKENWDNVNACPKPSHPNCKVINKKIGQLEDDIDFEKKMLERSGQKIILLKELKAKLKSTPVIPSMVKVLAFFDQVISDLANEGRIGYSNVFVSCKASVSKFLNDKDKAFVEFKQADFEGYEKFLLRSITESSTVSYYIRTFYRIWNLAIAKGICSKEHHPSKYISFKPYRKFKTKKRAISAEYINQIENLHFEPTSRMFRSQQYFLFSYYARGINFVDLCKLQHGQNIIGQTLKYTRSKNKRKYNFKLHSKAASIIEVFKNYPIKSDSDYIFPLLKKEHNTPKKIDARVDSALKDLNEDLEEIGKTIGLTNKLTSYVARHSFATNLRRKKVDIAVIQEAMGHETELQTMTYLEEIDDEIVANTIEEAL